VSVQRYVYEGGLLVNIYSAFIDNGYWIENFIYSNAKLAQKQWHGIDRLGAKIDRDYFYEYDELGELNSITLEGGYVCYKKPDKKTSYKNSWTGKHNQSPDDYMTVFISINEDSGHSYLNNAVRIVLTYI